MSCRQLDHKTAIFAIKRLFFFLFVTSPKKKSPKKLFCFSAPTNDDHATSAFYLLTQQRITKLQFLKSSKISKGYFSFFLSHFCTLAPKQVLLYGHFFSFKDGWKCFHILRFCPFYLGMYVLYWVEISTHMQASHLYRFPM